MTFKSKPCSLKDTCLSIIERAFKLLRWTLPGKDSPSPYNQLVASTMPTLCLSSIGTLDHRLYLTHTSPSPRMQGYSLHMYLNHLCLLLSLCVRNTFPSVSYSEFFLSKPHLFLSFNITRSLGIVPTVLRKTRSNPSLQSPAGTNPSDKGVWEKETFSCWMHNLSSVYSPVHLHH